MRSKYYLHNHCLFSSYTYRIHSFQDCPSRYTQSMPRIHIWRIGTTVHCPFQIRLRKCSFCCFFFTECCINDSFVSETVEAFTFLIALLDDSVFLFLSIYCVIWATFLNGTDSLDIIFWSKRNLWANRCLLLMVQIEYNSLKLKQLVNQQSSSL